MVITTQSHIDHLILAFLFVGFVLGIVIGYWAGGRVDEADRGRGFAGAESDVRGAGLSEDRLESGGS